mgnify:FL=1|nr:MAG TPA: helix-turn-helix domain protein [Bacteriophage sp.]
MRKKLSSIDRAFYEKLGEILNEKRRKCGYSLRYLAEMTGVSRTTIDRYELGIARIDDVRMKKICKALQMPESYDIDVTINFK